MKFLNPIRLISILIILAGFIFVLKLYDIQIVKHNEYVQIANNQYQRPQGFFDRGTIYFEDKDGNKISAATVKSGYILAINPELIVNKQDAYNKLSSVVSGIDKTDFLDKASEQDTYEVIQKEVDSDTGKKIQALNISGVILDSDNWRFYPGNSTASQVLGIVGYQGNDLAGRYGLEEEYNSVLERNQSDLYTNFFVQIFSNIKSSVDSDNSEGDIVTTIEPNVQAALENTLQKIQTTWSSEETGGIIMNPQNGEIIAMAAYPNFNPNDFSDVSSVGVFKNPLVEDVREMGSIMKVVTMASGIDAGLVTASTTYDDVGYVKADGSTIYNFDKQGRGVITMQTVLDDSLNTGASFVEQKLGNKRFTDYFFKFGLGEKTNIDLPDEAQDLVSNLQSTRDIEHITASYGQGIALTPIATARALAAVANGGYLVQPHVVKEADPIEGIPYYPFASYKPVQVISKSASQKVTAMLINVVDTALLGGAGKNPHYTVAAKTGTAQIPSPSGGYYSDRYLHSFMGYFPATNPQFLILMYTVYPKTQLYAASTLAQPFLDLSHFIINYYSIPPDR